MAWNPAHMTWKKSWQGGGWWPCPTNPEGLERYWFCKNVRIDHKYTTVYDRQALELEVKETWESTALTRPIQLQDDAPPPALRSTGSVASASQDDDDDGEEPQVAPPPKRQKMLVPVPKSSAAGQDSKGYWANEVGKGKSSKDSEK